MPAGGQLAPHDEVSAEELSDLLSLLLPDQATDRQHAGSDAASAPATPAAEAKASPATGSPPGALAAPAEQQARLRSFVERCCDAGAQGRYGSPMPGPVLPKAQPGMRSAAFAPGSMAEALHLRMGATPAAAELLQGLLCPLTQVRACTARGSLHPAPPNSSVLDIA